METIYNLFIFEHILYGKPFLASKIFPLFCDFSSLKKSSDLYEIHRLDNLEKDQHSYVRTKNNNLEFQF